MKKETIEEMREIFKKNLENMNFVCTGVICRVCPFWSIVEYQGTCGAFEFGKTPITIEDLKKTGHYPVECED